MSQNYSTTSLVRNSSVRKDKDTDYFTFDPEGDLVLLLEYPIQITLPEPQIAPKPSKRLSENAFSSPPRQTASELDLTTVSRSSTMHSTQSDPFPRISSPPTELSLTRTSSTRTSNTPRSSNGSTRAMNMTLMSGETLCSPSAHPAMNLKSSETLCSLRPIMSPDLNVMSTETLCAPITTITKPRQAQMLVSSKHLTLASPVFSAMLGHACFKEGEQLKPTGKGQVPLHDDDPLTFEILMYIIHNRPKRVPRKITLETFVKLAILVEKYQMLDIMDLYVEMWMSELKSSFPNSLTGDILSWLCVALVFRLPVEFANLTRILIYDGEWRVENRLEQGLPIPDRIFQKIEKKRLKHISDIFSSIKSLTDTFTNSPGVCGASSEVELRRHRNCDGMMLGTFIKSAAERNIWPAPKDPYEGRTIKELVLSIREMEFTSLCDMSSGKDDEAHGFLEWMREKMDEVDVSVKGLKLGIIPQCGIVSPI